MNQNLLIACILVFTWIGFNARSHAQCAHNPTVSGNLILCPNDNGTLTTQGADSYQWYKRDFSGPSLVPIAGATSQTLLVDNNDLLYYFAVEATVAGCSEMSPEVLLDGWVFLGITVSTEGNFQIGGSGEVLLCEGDTVFLNVMMPYDTNIEWYDGGNTIPGETQTTLEVTESGSFTVSGSPSLCPSYTEYMGIDIVVQTMDCSPVNCTHNPTVVGNLMLCPEGTGMLSTQTYDTYQWYQRAFSDTTWELIQGATSQTLNINYFDDVLYYFAVEATENNCTERSPEVLVDGWAFAGITVMSEGDFETGGNGELIICEGDTVFLSVMMPYDTNIVWFNGGQPIANQTNSTLVVTTAGSYTVEASPTTCPDFSQTMGIPIEVAVEECSINSISNLETPFVVSIFPNPTMNLITVDAGSIPITRCRLLNVLGQVIWEKQASAPVWTIDLSNFATGTYLLEIQTELGKQLRRIIRQ